jgi:hypothetical protein
MMQRCFLRLATRYWTRASSHGVPRRFMTRLGPSLRCTFSKITKKCGRAWAGPYLGTQLINGQDWQLYQAATVVTPPFPEYYSGHSVFSAAGAEILTQFTRSPLFGDCFTQAAGTSRVEPGLTPQSPMTLCWPTFKDAANQAGISRRYGGIHFIRSCGSRNGSADRSNRFPICTVLFQRRTKTEGD